MTKRKRSLRHDNTDTNPGGCNEDGVGERAETEERSEMDDGWDSGT